MAASKQDPLIKYRATYEGVSGADSASIEQAQAFAQILVQEMAQRSIISPAPILVAQQRTSATKAQFIAVDEMIADGFPTSQQCHLHFLFAKGAKAGDDAEDLAGISGKKNNNLIEVADAVRFWFTGSQQIVLNDITRQ